VPPITLIRLDRPIIEIRCGAPIEGTAVLFQVDELQPLRNDAGLPGTAGAPIADGVLEIHEQARFDFNVSLVDEHRTLREQELETFEYQVDDGIEQWMTRREKLRLRPGRRSTSMRPAKVWTCSAARTWCLVGREEYHQLDARSMF
jgi:hypothetical protein